MDGDLLAWLQVAAAIQMEPDDAALMADHLAILTQGGPAAAAAAFEIVRIAALNADAAAFEMLVIAAAPADAADEPAALALALTGASIALARIGWPNRRAATEARALTADLAERTFRHGPALGADLLGWLSKLAGLSIRVVSERAATLAPVVQVETGVSLPSTVLAYRLHGDARRAGELARFAGSVTPLIMPARFEAEAPDAP